MEASCHRDNRAEAWGLGLSLVDDAGVAATPVPFHIQELSFHIMELRIGAVRKNLSL
ncbi:hypothetical protein [Eleftheria terrae]|uniref:hypothetical protein n=1 Tax=Eleftheria terrae TaxID=1597781 RepID=UPI00263A8CAE|nr:hypothetical protein [Eleftheria terrae]WKB53054.1 hypothetical protein N7L95_01210 [Eleftheria terrae]